MAGIPFAARTESRRVPDFGGPVHSSLLPPGPERRPVLRRVATLATVAKTARFSDTLGHRLSTEYTARAAGSRWGRPRTPQTPPPAGLEGLRLAERSRTAPLVRQASGPSVPSRDCKGRIFGRSFIPFFLLPSLKFALSIPSSITHLYPCSQWNL